MSSSLGKGFAVSDVCAYRRLRNWPGLKPWLPLFICRSGLLKVKKLTLDLIPDLHQVDLGGPPPQGQQSLASFHKSLPGREISKVHFEPSAWDLCAICQAIFGTQTGRRQSEGRLCLPIEIVLSAIVTVGDISGLHSQISCSEERSSSFSLVTPILRKWKKWLIVVSTWGL